MNVNVLVWMRLQPGLCTLFRRAALICAERFSRQFQIGSKKLLGGLTALLHGNCEPLIRGNLVLGNSLSVACQNSQNDGGPVSSAFSGALQPAHRLAGVLGKLRMID